jgi:hypothetical protein
MWIEFRSVRPYAIKVRIGGINAISGEPIVETAATRLRRQNFMHQSKSIQDYIVIPKQQWLDGIATKSGQVRQFVAMPLGSGYSIETQVTGEDGTGGLQFDITPCEQNLIKLKIRSYFSEHAGPGVVEYHIDRHMTIAGLRQVLEADTRLGFGPQDHIWCDNTESGSSWDHKFLLRGNLEFLSHFV